MTVIFNPGNTPDGNRKKKKLYNSEIFIEDLIKAYTYLVGKPVA